MKVANIVLAAGRGTRMEGFNSNKTVLPLLPYSQRNPYEGDHPLIVEILSQLPTGPCAVVVHHDSEAVISATKGFDVEYIFQPVLNGTGGAILASRKFIEGVEASVIIITMGDVPLVRRTTYERLVDVATSEGKVGSLIVFEPLRKEKYGCVVIEDSCVRDIIEWQYWSKFPMDQQRKLNLCNAGIYAFRRTYLLSYMDILTGMPHVVEKTINGKNVKFEEFFLTDLIKMMSKDNLCIGYIEVPEHEVMGIDTPDSLKKAQNLYSKLKSLKSQ